jgi:hypothetical protein
MVAVALAASFARVEAGRDRQDGPVATPRPTQPVDWPELPDIETLEPVAVTERFHVYAVGASPFLEETAVSWAGEADDIAAFVQWRLGMADPPPIVHLVFAPAYGGNCPARGLATRTGGGREGVDGEAGEDRRLIQVFVDANTSVDQIRAVIGHEVTHAYTFTDDFVGDGVLTEGIANWAPGGLVRRWQDVESWPDEVRRRLADGTYISVADPAGLTPDPGEDCLARRDRVYNVRAAFTEWLIERVGRRTVLAMPGREIREAQEGSDEPVRRLLPDYVRATGFELEELETIWLAEVTRWL